MTMADKQDNINDPTDLDALKRLAATKDTTCRLVNRGTFFSRADRSQIRSPMSLAAETLGLFWDEPFPSDDELQQALAAGGIKLMLWQADAADPEAMQRVLLDTARHGVWNHLVFRARESGADAALLGFALNNPNIVHSYSFDPDGIVTAGPGAAATLASVRGYARVTPLPGKPLWECLATPQSLLHFLSRFGRDAVCRWRVMENGSQVRQIGSSIVYAYRRPRELPEGFMDEICRMVEAGGSVSMHQVRGNLERAFLIGYAMEFDRIVGNSSLKHPRPEYVEKLKRKSGYDFTGYLERGYTSVRPEYRGSGIGTRLLAGLTKRTEGKKLYSIITEDNLATQKIAARNRTRKLTTFFSDTIGKEVGVWVKE